MSDDAPVDPAEVPVFTGNEVELAAKVKALSGAGVKISTAAGDVHTSFGGLRAFYRAPEAEQLFATTKPVQDKALEVGSDLCVIAGALGTYADDIRPLVARLNRLREDAQDFHARIADDDKWRENGDLTDENLDRRNQIAEVWTQYEPTGSQPPALVLATPPHRPAVGLDRTHVMVDGLARLRSGPTKGLLRAVATALRPRCCVQRRERRRRLHLLQGAPGHLATACEREPARRPGFVFLDRLGDGP